ncbi:MAG: hypothetical protein IJD81_03805 [Oscillospiraceae bacterium]|nr:hypothetical protein [Oscillospiraceae bacterium]
MLHFDSFLYEKGGISRYRLSLRRICAKGTKIVKFVFRAGMYKAKNTYQVFECASEVSAHKTCISIAAGGEYLD